MNTEQARFNMVEQQIRPWNVLDQRVLDLMSSTPREDYVPASYRSVAFSDTNIPLGHGEMMMAPKIEARMIQALDIKPNDQTLEIGSGSGYVSALLARSCRAVTTVEIHEDLSRAAAEKLERHDIQNVTCCTGDGVAGWPQAGPYDCIAVTGSVHRLETCFQEQLRIGGRLFVIVGDTPVMEATLITRISDTQWGRESLFETSLSALAGAQSQPQFSL